MLAASRAQAEYCRDSPVVRLVRYARWCPVARRPQAWLELEFVLAHARTDQSTLKGIVVIRFKCKLTRCTATLLAVRYAADISALNGASTHGVAVVRRGRLSASNR
jgi:hypothetical protein